MPHTKEQAHAEIANLVANFRANEPSLADVPEAQIEDNYIRKLFGYLNWNTGNTGLSVAEWEFVLQRTDEKGKRPDYILQLDGQQLLVMDAKKVKYDMHDPRWMMQVYAYAYSTQNQHTPRKIDFALLTDFQEFILLDCTLYAADPKAVSNFRILDWTCDDYVSQFDTLWELFERENVRAAARSRDTKEPSGLWSRYLSPKEVKANRIPPDKSFLAKMDDEKTGWRVRLAKDMKKRNPDADGALITAAVQLLIDRLIFVKVLSDREIEADYLTQLAEQVEKSGISADDAGWFNTCRDIFAKLNQFYNGSIFEPRPELESVTVSNKVVREVIHDLQPENSPYNFAVLPVEILGTIYERFLGRVVHATEKQVRIEDKPEVRKAGGVYYTPQYIVDYIVQNTVGELLAKCKTPAEAAKLRILDPACGSGSFLLGAYAALIRWHQAYYSDKEQLTKRDREAAYYDSDGSVRLTAKLKRQILLNNLFGVDIDAQAVEVTRFSLSLKALEDTRRDELYEELNLFKQTVLPDLRHNIKHGNSLIGNDYSLLPMERLEVKTFEWSDEFPDIMTAGGFDVVIGNPPWLMAGYHIDNALDYLRNRFESATGKFDLYYVFIEQACRLVSDDGFLGMIVPNKFFHTKAASKLRSLLSKPKWIRSIIDFGDEQIFVGATNYSCILFLQKQPGRNPKYAKAKSGLTISKEIEIPWTVFSLDTWHFEEQETRILFVKLEQTGEPLEQLTTRFGTGVQSGADRLLMLDAASVREQKLETSLLTPVFRGRDVRRYSVSEDTKLLIFPYCVQRNEFAILTEAELQRHKHVYHLLSENKQQLAKRVWFGKGAEELSGKWYGMMYLDAHTSFKSPHILTPALSNRSNFALGNGNLFATGTAGVTSIIPKHDIPESIFYILGVLNSSPISFYATSHSPVFSGAYYKFSAPYLRKLPIRRINFSDAADKARHDSMVQLVESMLALHKHKAAARTQSEQERIQRQIDATDRQIDTLVYELYELTPEEIAVVTAKTK